jgi:hypothetical protein
MSRILIRFFYFISFLFSLLMMSGQANADDKYKIGTFYFPGWRSNQVGAPAILPWERIKVFPEREPLLGWYDDGDPVVLEQQLQWMYSYGIDFVVFDWYWDGRQTLLGHGLNAYLQTRSKHLVPFALLWANHTPVPRTKSDFTSMVEFWLNRYFHRPEYLKIGGKPIVFIFYHPHLIKQAEQLGQSFTSLLAEAENMARMRGYPGIYFIGGTHIHPSLIAQGLSSGYSAFSAYNYHGKAEHSKSNPESTSYAELDDAYRYIWKWIVTQSKIPYIVPMTQGWDKRPWGGSSNPLHDQSGGNPESFEKHLLAARNLMETYQDQTQRMGVICCWNEFGEGSNIEPTKKDGFIYLEKIRKIFGVRVRE